MADAAVHARETTARHDLLERIQARLRNYVRGKEEVIELALAGFLAGGHILLEGPPGTGKTSLAKGMASAFGGIFRRIQMTSDLLPSDIVGLLRLKPGQTEFEFRKGPIFSHFLLADELNRTSAKTQSALLEAMAEGTVTVDGTTYSLPDPFFVVATQNPMEFQGVYPLAESQLDRFMMQILLTTPGKTAEMSIYQAALTKELRRDHENSTHSRADEMPILSIEQTLELQSEVSKVFFEVSVLEYVSDLARATRIHKGISHGVSVRGGLQLIAAARALAVVRGRDFVTPKDVSDLAIPILAHRLCFSSGEPEVHWRHEVIREVLERVKAPR